jgi:hypothetical protein
MGLCHDVEPEVPRARELGLKQSGGRGLRTSTRRWVGVAIVGGSGERGTHRRSVDGCPSEGEGVREEWEVRSPSRGDQARFNSAGGSEDASQRVCRRPLATGCGTIAAASSDPVYSDQCRPALPSTPCHRASTDSGYRWGGEPRVGHTATMWPSQSVNTTCTA